MGKPSVYLDQNILDLLLKKASNEILNYISSNWVVYCSHVTLSEIYKAGANSSSLNHLESFLSILDRLNAKFIFQTMDFSNNQGYFIELSVSAHEAYAKYTEEILSFENILPNTLKFGMINYSHINSPNEWVDAQVGELIRLFIFINDGKIILEEELEKGTYSDIEKANIKKFILSIEIQLEQLLEQLPSTESGLRNFAHELSQLDVEKGLSKIIRQEYKINYDNLNKIEGHGAFEKIVLYIKSQNLINSETLKEFLVNIDNESKPIHQRIMFAYDFLNLIGYKVDKSLHKENRYLGAMKDCEHVGLASLCDWFISNDQRLNAKAKIIYEYLGVPTHVYSFDELTDNSFRLKLIT